MNMLRFSKKLLVDVKAKYSSLDFKLLDVRDREPVRRSIRLGDDFDWL